MIIGIGCDIVEHSTTLKLGWLEDMTTLTRIFSKREIALAPKEDLEKYYSGRFAVKEAILKSLGTGMQDGIALSDIEIEKTNLGAMRAVLKRRIKEIADSQNITTWHISVSHSKNYTIAFVVAEN